MRRTNVLPLTLPAPEDIRDFWVDARSGLLSAEDCPDSLVLPFIDGSQPRVQSECLGRTDKGFFEKWFE